MRKISKEERAEVYKGLKDVLESSSLEKRDKIYSAVLWFILEGEEADFSIEIRGLISLLKPYLINMHQAKQKGALK